MEGGERKEEVSLPPDYVSLAQLQERWLRKQEERKLKEKQEEEDKRERDARAQNERGPAKTAGGFVRATGVVQDKGKGKEIVGGGGPGNGGEIKKKRKKNGKKKGKFKGATAVEEKEKAEVLSGGGAGRAAILSGEGGIGGGLSGVEELVNVSAVELLPINGEIANVKRTGLKKYGRNKGSRRVNELKQSEMALDLKKGKEEGEGENGHGMKCGERGRVNELKQSEVALDLKKGKEKEKEKEGEREGEREGENGHGVKCGERGRGRKGGRVNELKQSEVALDLKKGKEKEKEKEKEGEREGENGHGVKCGERGRGRKGGRVNELKQSEVALDLEKGKEEGGENDRGMKWRERGRETGGERGRNVGRVNELNQSKVALDLEEEEEGENDRDMKCKERGRNGGYPERRINRKKEYRTVVLTGNEVDSKLENKAEDGISEVCSKISSLNVADKNGIRGRENKAKEDGGVEGQSLNGDKVALESEKKMDHEVLARKSENFGRGYRTNGNPRGGFGRGHRTNGIPGRGYGRDRRYKRAQISDRMNSTDSVKVWVKKEDKLDS